MAVAGGDGSGLLFLLLGGVALARRSREPTENLETSKNGEFQITIPTISFKSAPSIVQIFLVAKNTKKKCYLTIQPPKVVIQKTTKTSD
jgi:hypothetical protein